MTKRIETIDDVPDKVLADMIRTGCYARNTRFSDEIKEGKFDAQYLLVLAVPYGHDEGVDSMIDAVEAFKCFLASSDWNERRIQVLSIKNNKPVVVETSHEILEALI